MSHKHLIWFERIYVKSSHQNHKKTHIHIQQIQAPFLWQRQQTILRGYR